MRRILAFLKSSSNPVISVKSGKRYVWLNGVMEKDQVCFIEILARATNLFGIGQEDRILQKQKSVQKYTNKYK